MPQEEQARQLEQWISQAERLLAVPDVEVLTARHPEQVVLALAQELGVLQRRVQYAEVLLTGLQLRLARLTGGNSPAR
jgi:hypothetical protein